MTHSLLMEAPHRLDPAEIAAFPPQACGDPGTGHVPPSSPVPGNLLGCASCGAVPSLTTTDARCGCSIDQLLAATEARRHADVGQPQCRCGYRGALIDNECFVCAGILEHHARGDR